MAIPSVGFSFELPDIELPILDSSNFPQLQPSDHGPIADRMVVVRGAMSSQYNDTLEFVSGITAMTEDMRAMIGSPSGVSIQPSAAPPSGNERHVMGQPHPTGSLPTPRTAYQVAVELSASMRASLGYVRAVADIGPLGLDLSFIVLGLAWIVIVSVMQLAITLIAWVVRTIFKLFDFALRILRLFLAFLAFLWNIVRGILGR